MVGTAVTQLRRGCEPRPPTTSSLPSGAPGGVVPFLERYTVSVETSEGQYTRMTFVVRETTDDR